MKSRVSTAACIVAVFAGSAALAFSAEPAAPTGKLTSTFYPWSSLLPKATPTGGRVAVFDSPTTTFERFEMHLTELNPGTPAPAPTKHPMEVVVLVKEGKLRLSLEGQEHLLGPGALVFMAPNALHSFANVGNTLAIYYVVEVETEATQSPASGPAQPGAKPRIGSTVYDCEALPKQETKNGFRCPIVTAPTATLEEFESHITTLNPGKTLGSLTDLADEVIVIKSGLVDVSIKGVTARLGAGSFYFQASRDEHSVVNVGDTPASYQILKFVSKKTPHAP